MILFLLILCLTLLYFIFLQHSIVTYFEYQKWLYKKLGNLYMKIILAEILLNQEAIMHWKFFLVKYLIRYTKVLKKIADLSKVKEHYGLLFIKRSKNNSQTIKNSCSTSKNCRKPKNCWHTVLAVCKWNFAFFLKIFKIRYFMNFQSYSLN